MPNRPKRPCRKPGCAARVESGYCPVHKSSAGDYDKWRGTAASRGYDSRWSRFSKLYLMRNPVCVDCLRVAATETHHVKKLDENPEFKYDEEWLRALCKGCHSIRTKRGE